MTSHLRAFGSVLILAAALQGCATPSSSSSVVSYGVLGQPQIFEGMGPYHRTVTTDSAEAQAYFDQGFTWMCAFNHDEAARAFQRAAEIDPGCAMAWWGISVAAGPQYNHPVMTPERTARAWDAMNKALAALDDETLVEFALVQALRYRNPEQEPEDRAGLNEAYAQAMGEVWLAYPGDADVGALYAESMMVLHPWKLYSVDKVPREGTGHIVVTLERVLEFDPDHPGALHLYVHAIEPSADPYRAVPAADRLSGLVPGSGHLQHMPSHIYVKTGYWESAVVQNELAMDADEIYRARTDIPMAQHTYMTHNAHMRAYASMMCGREQEAMLSARDMWVNVDDDITRTIGPRIDRWMCSVYDVQKRFGRWDAILAEPAPPSHMVLTTATWRAARAVAFAAKKDFASAEREHELFRAEMDEIPEDIQWGRDKARNVLMVSDYFIAGEIALQQGRWDEAASLLEQAAAVEDTLGYGEPPQWLQPVRHTLGAVYLKAGRYADAERAYREDLAKWPRNGWSLYGLSRALEEQGDDVEAAKVRSEFELVWAEADEPIATSCKCIPTT